MTNPVIQTIQDRASSPKLTSPGPTTEQLEEILACAQRAPDHARLKPWNLWLIEGQDRNKLGQVFAEAILDTNPDAPDVKLDKCRSMPLRSPLMIVATCQPTPTPKVPDHEQVLAVGAAIQNMQIAISSLGLGSIWRTGEMSEHPHVKKAFGLDDNGVIVGFLYIGTPEKPTVKQEVDPRTNVKSWPAN